MKEESPRPFGRMRPRSATLRGAAGSSPPSSPRGSSSTGAAFVTSLFFTGSSNLSSSPVYYVSVLAIAIISVAQLRGVYESARDMTSSIVMLPSSSWSPGGGAPLVRTTTLAASSSLSSSSDVDDPYYASIVAHLSRKSSTTATSYGERSSTRGEGPSREVSSSQNLDEEGSFESTSGSGEELDAGITSKPENEKEGRVINTSPSASVLETTEQLSEPVPHDAVGVVTVDEKTDAREGVPDSPRDEPSAYVDAFKENEDSLDATTTIPSDSTRTTTTNAENGMRPPRVYPSVFYSAARTDRAGASIRDMVLALAYGYAHNLTYGGACYVYPMRDAAERQADKDALIRSIGLQDVLKFDCPDSFHHQLLQPEDYTSRSQRTKLLSPDFINWLRSKVVVNSESIPGGDVVVHVRRGDIDPCFNWVDRYLPNAYYRDVLRKYVPPQLPVTIFSESWSFEEWNDFPSPRFNVRLDTDLAEVWKAVMSAQYVVLSYSSFVYIPAILNPNATVLYAPTWQFVPLPHWTKVAMSIRRKSTAQVKKLAATKCSTHESLLPGTSLLRGTKNESLIRLS